MISTEATLISDLAALLDARPVGTEPDAAPDGHSCIAFVGSAKYDDDQLYAFMVQLAGKYPDATIVTGEGLGAERAVATYAAELGFRVTIPYKDKDRWGKDASYIQVFDVCRGHALWDAVQERATVLVVVGDTDGSRPRDAIMWWNRSYGRQGKQLWGMVVPKTHFMHKIAALPKEAKVKKRAVSKTKRNARAAA